MIKKKTARNEERRNCMAQLEPRRCCGTYLPTKCLYFVTNQRYGKLSGSSRPIRCCGGRHFSSRVINILDESTKTWYIIPHHDEKKQKHIAQWLDYPIISDNFSPHGWLVIWKGFAKYRTIRCDKKWRRNIKIFFVSIRRLIYNLLITENTNHQKHSS